MSYQSSAEDHDPTNTAQTAASTDPATDGAQVAMALQTLLTQMVRATHPNPLYPLWRYDSLQFNFEQS